MHVGEKQVLESENAARLDEDRAAPQKRREPAVREEALHDGSRRAHVAEHQVRHADRHAVHGVKQEIGEKAPEVLVPLRRDRLHEELVEKPRAERAREQQEEQLGLHHRVDLFQGNPRFHAYRIVIYGEKPLPQRVITERKPAAMIGAP